MTLSRTGPTAPVPAGTRHRQPRLMFDHATSALLHLQLSAGNTAVVHHLEQLQQRSHRSPALLPVQRSGPTAGGCSDEEPVAVQTTPPTTIQRCGPRPCSCTDAERADYDARHQTNVVLSVTDDSLSVQRSADEDLSAYLAKTLAGYAASNRAPVAHIRSIFATLDSDIKDNVAADFTELQNTEQLETYAASPEGRAMLDAMTEAMITVT